jgi:acetyl esterase/lipase
MKRLTCHAAGVILCILLMTAPACSQTVKLWPDVAPGSAQWTQHERVIPGTPAGTVVLDVVTPTLTAYLPEPGKATGTGIIIAPGGYCLALAIDKEGREVARWLQQNGIAAFVLKYRTREKKQEGIPEDLDMDQACRYGIADGIQAMKLVRQRAKTWGISPHRVGFMGFSAGGMVASGVLLQADPAARPDFVALIYGAPFGVMPAIPANLPPIFMAWARDDTLAGGAVARFRQALEEAGNHPEVHLFATGGHGFGVRKQGTHSDRWTEEFQRWLQAQGFAIEPGKAPGRASAVP